MRTPVASAIAFATAAIGGTIIARVGHTLDAEVSCPPIALWVLPEGQNPVERRAQLSTDFDRDIAIAQIILAVRLRIVRGVEAQTFQIHPECTEVDVLRRGIRYRALLNHEVSESVVVVLEVRRRRLDAAAIAANPDVGNFQSTVRGVQRWFVITTNQVDRNADSQ